MLWVPARTIGAAISWKIGTTDCGQARGTNFRHRRAARKAFSKPVNKHIHETLKFQEAMLKFQGCFKILMLLAPSVASSAPSITRNNSEAYRFDEYRASIPQRKDPQLPDRELTKRIIIVTDLLCQEHLLKIS
jgi:hypothetical protein